MSFRMSICEALEASLFGTAGNLQPLPLAWLEAVLANRCTAAEQKVWEFKQKLINIMSQYEKKKKVCMYCCCFLFCELQSWSNLGY